MLRLLCFFRLLFDWDAGQRQKAAAQGEGVNMQIWILPFGEDPAWQQQQQTIKLGLLTSQSAVVNKPLPVGCSSVERQPQVKS